MIYRESVDREETVEDSVSDFFADFDLYTSMAHFVGKTLHIRPVEILTTWGVAELVVAYGQYTNEITSRNYEEWKHLDRKDRIKIEKPDKYNVEFHGLLEDE